MTEKTKTTYETNLRVGLKASPQQVYEALTDPSKLARWWTSDTRGRGAEVGSTLEFLFGPFCQKFEVEALEPGALVRWKATKQGAAEWAGTKITFTISTDEAQTLVRFRHSGWRANTDFFAHCAMKWATFLLSFKDFLEKGQGRPAPRDLAITHE